MYEVQITDIGRMCNSVVTKTTRGTRQLPQIFFSGIGPTNIRVMDFNGTEILQPWTGNLERIISTQECLEFNDSKSRRT